MAILINGTRIKNPNKFNEELYMITESTRIANGSMDMDFISLKRKFIFGYNSIESKDVALIRKLLWSDMAVTRNCFVTLTIPTETGTENITVYPGSIPLPLHRADSRNWVWKDVSFSLIER